VPNHVTNRITVDSKMEEIIKKLFGKKDEDGNTVYVDFNNIISMPKELLHTQSPNKQIEGETEEEHNTRINDLIKKYGYANWYDWNIHNWGTKWNAYQTSVEEGNTFVFQTAWSHPLRIVEQLSSAFPTVKFEVKYADEDIGSNLGDYIMQDGNILVDNTPQEDMDRTIFACDVLDVDINEVLKAELEEEYSYEETI